MTISGGTLDLKATGEGSKTIKSKGNITIANGDITLTTTGSAYYDADISSSAGIKATGNFVMEKGNLTIISSGAGGKGINVDGTLTINDGVISVVTTGDQFKYGKDDTAAKAIKSDGDLTVNGGTITIKTSKTEAEGLESKATLTINNGKIEIEAYDDCINAIKHIQIYGGSGTANQFIHIESSDGTGVLTFKIPRAYNQMILLFSSASLISNTSYTIYTGGSNAGGTDFHGLYTGATYTKGTSAGTFTPTLW